MADDPDDPYLNPSHRFRQLSRAPKSPRGVVEALHAPDGYRRFSVVTSEGELLTDMLVINRLAERPGFTENLHRLLDREDPLVTLSIVS